MIGVDTNLLVRLFTADHPDQHRKAVEFFSRCSVDEPAFVSSVTMAETIWVLRSRYNYSFDEVQVAVSGLLDSDDFVLEGRSALEQARFASEPALMADFLVAYLGQRAGCAKTVTFDRRAASAVPGMDFLT